MDRGAWQVATVRQDLATKERENNLPKYTEFLEEEMATHSSILAWEISWTEEPGGLQPMWSQKWDISD